MSLVLLDAVLYFRSGYSRFTASNDSWSNASCLLIAVQDLGDTAMRYLELSTDVAWPDSFGSHFNDLEPNAVGQWPSIDEHASQLIHPSLSCCRSSSKRC